MGFNKKKGISAVAVLLVLAIFNAVAFLLPIEHIVGIIAPASVAIPQKIGKTASVYENNNVLYIPKVQDFMLNSDIESQSPEYCVYFTFDEDDTSTAINSDTMVGITSKILIGENYDWVGQELKKSSLESSAT